ncbi:MAG: hypothetical protein QMD92_03965 [bacterium]|nr:hypothetical protein [bacterium]
MKYLISFLMINVFFLTTTWAKVEDKKIIIEHAEKLSFVSKDKKKVINLKGKVKLLNEQTTLYAQYVQFIPKSKLLIAQKEVLLEDKNQKVWGDRLILNVDTNQGQIKNIKSYQEPTFYKGNIAYIKSRNHYGIKEASLTTCNLKCNHYSMKAKSIDLKIKDRFLAKNVFLKIGNTPLFYLPCYRGSLKDKHTHLSVKPGCSKSDGWTTKVKYHYCLNKNNSGLMLLDYYELRGFGRGFNHEYTVEGQSKGRLNFYYIKEDRDPNAKIRRRWSVSNHYYQTFPNNLTLTNNINYVSDKSFSKYYGESIYGLTNEIRSNISLTKRVPAYYTLGATYDRYDVLDKNKDKIVKKEELLPSINFNTTRLELKKSEWFYTIFTQFGRKYKNKYYYNFLDGNIDLLKNYHFPRYKIGRWISFSPSFSLDGDWKDKESIQKNESYYDAHYHTNFVVPIKLYRKKIRINPQYSYKRSFKDSKIKKNKLKVEYIHLLKRNMDINSAFGYNCLKKEYDNLTTQLTIKREDFKLGKNLKFKTANFFLNNNYNIEKQEIKSIDTSLNASVEKNKKNYCFYLGSSYVPNTMSQLRGKFSTDFIKFLDLSFCTWYDLKKQEFQQGEIILKRDLHCFESQLNIQRSKVYGSSPVEWETNVSYRLNLKSFKDTKLSISQDGNVGKFGLGDVFEY